MDGIKEVLINKSGEVNTLFFFQALKDIPFEIKRIYFITNLASGEKRGFHAHINLKQLILCPYGKIDVSLKDGITKKIIKLHDPSLGLLISKPIWRELEWLQENSVLLVAASDYYYESDYIRNYQQFLDYIHSIKRKKEGL
jgi:hypothetical protein